MENRFFFHEQIYEKLCLSRSKTISKLSWLLVLALRVLTNEQLSYLSQFRQRIFIQNIHFTLLEYQPLVKADALTYHDNCTYAVVSVKKLWQD